MAFSPTFPVAGAAMTGFTNPTYTFVEDGTDSNSRKFVVVALGGTQAGVEVHSVSSPFYVTVSRASQIKSLPRQSALGVFPAIPSNVWNIKFIKGTAINGSAVGSASQQIVLADFRIRTPAGVELATNNPEELKALLSFIGGFLNANASGLYDLIATGLLY